MKIIEDQNKITINGIEAVFVQRKQRSEFQSCLNCIFEEYDSEFCDKIPCREEERNDKKSGIFKEIKNGNNG